MGPRIDRRVYGFSNNLLIPPPPLCKFVADLKIFFFAVGLRFFSPPTKMLALSSLYALCVWMSLTGSSEGTSFVYHFPSITVQRQRIKSEQSGSSGPPGTGPRTQLRWAHVRCISFGPSMLMLLKASLQHCIYRHCHCLVSYARNLLHGSSSSSSFLDSSSSLFRNWCQYTVSKTVSCQVQNGTETTVQRVLQGCRWPGPCTKVIR